MPATISAAGRGRIVTVNADDFTDFLADRLAAIVPAGFHVEARDGMLWYSADPGRFPGQQGDYRTGQVATCVRDTLGTYADPDADGRDRLRFSARDGPGRGRRGA
jgi:hypothetical protein